LKAKKEGFILVLKITINNNKYKQQTFNFLMETKQWFVYILECHNDSLYTGITNDLEKRMLTHKSGKGSKYVRAKGFKKLLHAISTTNKSEAAKMEYQIKQLERNDKITFFMKHPDLLNNQSKEN